MHTITNMIKKIRQGMLCLLPLFTLTACSGKEEIVINQNNQEEYRETEEPSEVSTEPGASGEMSEKGRPAAEEKEDIPDGFTDTERSSRRDIYVHICGAVVNPGVYALAADSRIYEGIEAAGGFCENACEDYVNLAKPLQDGQRLVIPTQEEVESGEESDAYHRRWMTEDTEAEDTGMELQAVEAGQDISAGADGLININQASESELSSISGIGAGKAAAIVKYRQEIGGFTSIEEIMEVSGIGQGIFEKIKDKITVH